MSTLISNKYVKSIIVLFGFILFSIFVLPIVSILCEIIFKFGNIVGTFIRTFGIC